MRALGAGLILAALAGVAHAATPAETIAAVTTICEPASTKYIAPHDLAEKAGWSREAGPPPAILALFPFSRIGSASYVKHVEGGDLHVVSTVFPPPATPFSCLVAVDGAVEDFGDRLKAALTGRAGYSPMQINASPGAEAEQLTLDKHDDKSGAVDKVMMLRWTSPRPDIAAVVVAFRVDRGSAVAGGLSGSDH